MKRMDVPQSRKLLSTPHQPPPAPPPPPLPVSKYYYWWIPSGPAPTWSVTKEQIADFWRRKKIEHEDHLLAAIKAAATIREKRLAEEDCSKKMDSLEEDNDESSENEDNNNNKNEDENENGKEIRVGIKDWWTKSKYAYLNEPAIKSMDKSKKNTSTYVPNSFIYKAPQPLPTSFGVF